MWRDVDPLDACTGFEWDEANTPKNWEQHRVTQEEAEDVFFNEPLVVRGDIRHSQGNLRPRHEPKRKIGLCQARKRSRCLNFGRKTTNARSGRTTIRRNSSIGSPPGGASFQI